MGEGEARREHLAGERRCCGSHRARDARWRSSSSSPFKSAPPRSRVSTQIMYLAPRWRGWAGVGVPLQPVVDGGLDMEADGQPELVAVPCRPLCELQRPCHPATSRVSFPSTSAAVRCPELVGVPCDRP
jgi:hypothetical protein